MTAEDQTAVDPVAQPEPAVEPAAEPVAPAETEQPETTGEDLPSDDQHPAHGLLRRLEDEIAYLGGGVVERLSGIIDQIRKSL